MRKFMNSRLFAALVLAVALVAALFVVPITDLATGLGVAAIVYVAGNQLALVASGWIARAYGPACHDYFEQCLPTFAEAPDSSGTSLTRYTTHALTPEEFVADGISENLRDVYGNLAIAPIMRGYQPTFLDMVLFGRIRDYSMHLDKRKVGYQSIIQPFITLPKEDVVNTGAFVVTAGAAGDEDYQWTLTIENGNADWQNQDLPAIDTQFVVGDTLLIFFVAEDGSNLVKHMEVVSSADATYGGTPAATVVVKAPYNQAQWDALTETEQEYWQPTGGLVMFAGNSTSNYRSRCNQKGLYNSRSLAHYWFQTTRKMFQWTDEYEEVNNAKTMSEFFKAFLRIPLAKQIQILDQDHMRSMANDLFWGQPYAGQNVETWQTAGNLPVVYDLDGTTVMDVETRLKGIETQLDECGRVIDLLGGAFDFDQVKELLPIISRNRQGTGAARDQVWTIDMLVNPTTAALMKRTITDKYSREWPNIQNNQILKESSTNDTFAKQGVWSNTYHLDEINTTLNVISGQFLDDFFHQAPTGHKSAASYAMFLDFTDIDWFFLESKKRNVEYPPRNIPIDATKCLIDFNVRTIRMESMTHGLAVKNPSRHLIVKGFSPTACPTYTPNVCVYEG